MFFNFSIIDEQIVEFEAVSMGITEAGYAFLFDQEGQIIVIVKNWDWVELIESNPEVK